MEFEDSAPAVAEMEYDMAFNLLAEMLGGGFKHFYFHPYLGKIPILTNIFQRG